MKIVFFAKKPGQRQKKKRREQRLNSIKKTGRSPLFDVGLQLFNHDE
jgi:hypothetical protein